MSFSISWISANSFNLHLQNPEFKSKGIKKNNITNIYEDNHKKDQKQET